MLFIGVAKYIQERINAIESESSTQVEVFVKENTNDIYIDLTVYVCKGLDLVRLCIAKDCNLLSNIPVEHSKLISVGYKNPDGIVDILNELFAGCNFKLIRKLRKIRKVRETEE